MSHKLNHRCIAANRFIALAALLGVASMTILFSLEACGGQGKELQSPSPKPKQVVSTTGVPVGITVVMPRDLKNADRDTAILKESSVVVSILSKDELYVGSERIPKDDSDSKLRAKIDELLERTTETSKTVYIAGSVSVYYGVVVNVINSIRKEHVDRIGLIVDGNGGPHRFLVLIPPELDPNQDLSKLKPNLLLLGISISTDLQVKLITGGYEGILTGQSEAKGTVNDTARLSQTLARIFQERKEQHMYKPGMETRTDLPEDERVEKTVVTKASRYCRYGDVIKIIDVVKGTGANPISLQIDDLP